MSNHVHLVLVPQQKQAIPQLIARCHRSHALHVNKLRDRTGHLWENHYYAAAMDEAHLGMALRYVERNPVRAGMVQRAVDYPWSSAFAHARRVKAAGLLDWEYWDALPYSRNWAARLEAPVETALEARIREATRRNRPVQADPLPLAA
jgi:putative transposase